MGAPDDKDLSRVIWGAIQSFSMAWSEKFCCGLEQQTRDCNKLQLSKWGKLKLWVNRCSLHLGVHPHAPCPVVAAEPLDAYVSHHQTREEVDLDDSRTHL